MFPLSGSSWQSLIFMVVFFWWFMLPNHNFYINTHTHTQSHTPTLFTVQICADEKPSGNVFLSQSIDMLSNRIILMNLLNAMRIFIRNIKYNEWFTDSSFFFFLYFLMILTVNPVPVETTDWNTDRDGEKRVHSQIVLFIMNARVSLNARKLWINGPNNGSKLLRYSLHLHLFLSTTSSFYSFFFSYGTVMKERKNESHKLIASTWIGAFFCRTFFNPKKTTCSTSKLSILLQIHGYKTIYTTYIYFIDKSATTTVKLNVWKTNGKRVFKRSSKRNLF